MGYVNVPILQRLPQNQGRQGINQGPTSSNLNPKSPISKPRSNGYAVWQPQIEAVH